MTTMTYYDEKMADDMLILCDNLIISVVVLACCSFNAGLYKSVYCMRLNGSLKNGLIVCLLVHKSGHTLNKTTQSIFNRIQNNHDEHTLSSLRPHKYVWHDHFDAPRVTSSETHF
jgi:hypothetical protein